jgi:hypothetical protein
MSPISSISTASVAASDPTALQRQLIEAERKAAMDAAAKALGMKATELQQQLQSGNSLKDVAAARGVDFSTVQNAVSDAVKPQLDQAVSAGQLTTSQASSALGRLTSGQALKGHHHHHAGGAPPPLPLPAASDTTSNAASGSTYSATGVPTAYASGAVLNASA